MNNIKDLFVSYEIAKQLKEKGFNELCFQMIDAVGNAHGRDFWQNSDMVFGVALPLYQQVVDWFRVEHSINIGEFPNKNKIGFFILNKGKITKISNGNYYNTFKKAIEEAIKLI